MAGVRDALTARRTLLSQTVPGAGTTTTTPITDWPGVRSLTVQAVFTYGSGGTTCKAWLQTSLDGGTTWVDVMCFAFATATATKISKIDDRQLPSSQAFAPSDGALADNTVVQGVLGDRWRVKQTVVGTYATTTLALTAVARP